MPVNDITYSQFGFHSAQKSQSNPESIEGYLAKVYEKFLEDFIILSSL